MTRVTIDGPAPDFEPADFDGHVFGLSDLRDRRRVLLVYTRAGVSAGQSGYNSCRHEPFNEGGEASGDL